MLPRHASSLTDVRTTAVSCHAALTGDPAEVYRQYPPHGGGGGLHRMWTYVLLEAGWRLDPAAHAALDISGRCTYYYTSKANTEQH